MPSREPSHSMTLGRPRGLNSLADLGTVGREKDGQSSATWGTGRWAPCS